MKDVEDDSCGQANDGSNSATMCARRCTGTNVSSEVNKWPMVRYDVVVAGVVRC